MPKWLSYSLLTLVLWAGWALVGAAAAKTGAHPLVVQAVSAIGTAPVGALFWLQDVRLRPPRSARGVWLGLAAGVLGNVGQVALLSALSAGGPASIVYPLTGLYPLVTVFVAVALLGERLNVVQWVGVFTAGCAIWLFSLPSESTGAQPQTGWLSLWTGFSLAALACFGLVAVLQKVATRHISVELCTACFCGAFLPFAAGIVLADRLGLIGPLDWNPAPRAWGVSVLYGALLGAGTVAQFAAFRWGKASIVTPLTALYPALVVIAAVPVLDEAFPAPRIWTAIGLSLIAAVALSVEERPAWLKRLTERANDASRRSH